MPRIGAEVLESMADALSVLAHAHRLRIIELLDIKGAVPVHDIVEDLGLPQASVSNHLSKMKRAGLVRAERRAREIWYSVANPHSLTILDCIRKKEKEA